jgi:DNA-binding GntR family transcriptional regulator
MDKALVLGPVQQESAPLRRKISSLLRQAIETQMLPAGTRLIEKNLCQELNVSRTALRESLRELEAEGLITNGAKGMVVAAISAEEAINVYAVRGALEALVVEQFAERADDEAMKALEVSVDILAKSYEQQDVKKIVVAKAEFYEALCNGASNLIALELLTRLNSRITRLRFASLSKSSRLPTSISEIRDLVAALKQRNAGEARAIALRHVSNAAKAAIGNGKDQV